MGVRSAVNPVHRQRGVALLTALLIAAILSSLCVYLAWDRMLAFRRTQSMIEQDHARELCLGVEAWAAQTLAGLANQPSVDLGQSWASPMEPKHIGGGEVGGRLEDLQGRFNLNNLVTGEDVVGTSRTRFVRLLELERLPPGLADAVIDWIDADDVPRGTEGAEDGAYLSGRPRYRAANFSFLSPSTLRLVRGVDHDAYVRMAPLITALPTQTPINVNTASAPMLAALGLGSERAGAVLRLRKKHPFRSLSEFLRSPPLAGIQIDRNRLAVSSRFFLLRAEARFGRARRVLYSVLRVENADRVRVVERSWNTPP